MSNTRNKIKSHITNSTRMAEKWVNIFSIEECLANEIIRKRHIYPNRKMG